ncbi:hypothetical protein FSHL1_008734 [Fusarium sambucinum]
MKFAIFLIQFFNLLVIAAVTRPGQYPAPSEVQTRVEAVKCLDKIPSKIGLKTSRYNALPYVHTKLNIQIHFVAQFLPWHRYFVHLYETALRNECGYRSSMPYWDWTLDAKDMSKSPLFQKIRLGVSAAMGSMEGFNNFTVQYYDGALRPHCLNRGFNDGFNFAEKFQGKSYSPSAVSKIIDRSMNLTRFATVLENGPHGAIHQAVGGDLVPSTSPNDPIFFLHHAQINRLWWIWQQKNPKQRNTDYSGIRILASGATESKPASPKDMLPMLGLGPDKQLSGMNHSVTIAWTYIHNMRCFR